MKTSHHCYFQNAQQMDFIADESIDLMVTSPPYPMVEMWDDIFAEQNPKIYRALKTQYGYTAFELMHQILDPVWQEVWRVLKPGGMACVNIGDATRTLDSRFALFTNHTRIQSHMLELGFSALPCILWRKQTNAPNKFMGSGMLPAGAYVTLEHEYILIFRKGDKRLFSSFGDKQNRRESAYFWEERNQWFSDVWMDLKGTTQGLSDNGSRSRSGAFPFELAYRLVNMFSVKQDLVLDPFCGIGTTMFAAMVAGRNFIGVDIDSGLKQIILSHVEHIIDFSDIIIRQRLQSHQHFVEHRVREKGPLKHANTHYGFPVMTAQEKDLLLSRPLSLERVNDHSFEIYYSDGCQEEMINQNELKPNILADRITLKKMKTMNSDHK